MSTLKVNKLRDTAGSADAITLDPNGGAVLAGVTTVSTVKVGSGVTISSDGDVFTTGITTSSTVIVGSGVTISESGIEASGIGITVANINGTQIGGRRNIIINGAMNVAQRGTSSTTDGYQTFDRFSVEDGNEDESCTREQAAVTSGGAYNAGFRNCLKITNGNQTGGAGATDYIQIMQRVEAQNMANSGWNFASSSSFITLSFWVKTSVAQAFSGSLRTADGTAYSYKFDTPIIPPNTWTKVVKTIPGNSNLTFADDNGDGLSVYLYAYLGTTYTSSNTNTETWITAATDTYSNDMSQNWWTTNDATFEVTGFQLEVGPQATAFEHRSFGEELALCQRYYYRITPSNQGFYGVGNIDGGNQGQILINFPVTMRSKPTSLETTGTATDYILRVTSNVNCTGVPSIDNTSPDNALVIPAASSHGLTDKSGAFLRAGSDSSFLGFVGAEL